MENSLRVKILFCSLLIGLLLCACTKQKSNSFGGEVYVEKKSGKYILYRNGLPFAIKGAAGYSHFSTLKETGGNTIRIWDTTNLATVLDSAQSNHLAVIVGLPIPNNDNYMSFYNDSAKVAIQYKAFKAIINKFKDNPAILMWCLGNELSFPYKLTYNNFYKAFNDLTDMIHQNDPDHPVTTTILNFNTKYIFNIAVRCNIDILSFNIFSKISQLRDDLKQISWCWNGPYMLTEWGIDGPWPGTEQTAWGAYIENTSKKKAEFYLNRYERNMPVEDPRFLGSFVFFWGNKQETTHTWFSMFDEQGACSEAVGIMNYLWTSKPPLHKSPAIKYMLLNKKGAKDNIILNPSEVSTAEVLMYNLTDSIKTISWQIFREDWYKRNRKNNTQKLKPIDSLVKIIQNRKATFVAPAEEGPYRIFATIYDHYGNFATCNTPFYVVSDQ